MTTRRLRRSACAAGTATSLLLLGAPATLPSQEVAEAGLTSASVATVRFRGTALFEVRATVGNLAPPERARAIEGRLATVAAGSSEELAALQVVERDRSSDVVVGEQLVVSVTDADAVPLGRTRQQMAADVVVAVRRALGDEFSGRSIRGIATAVALTVVASLLLVVAWRLLRGLFARADTLVRSWEGTRIEGLHLRGVEMVSAARMTAAVAQVVRLLHWLMLAIALVIYVETVLAYFPWTRAAALQFRGFVKGALSTMVDGTLRYLPNLFYIALIVVVVRLVMHGASLIFGALEAGTLHLGAFRRDWARPTEKIVRFLILAFAAVVIFPYLPGAGSPAFQGVSIFFGVLLSLGSSSAVANVVAGIVMTYMAPFRVGDRVKVGDTIGDIVESNLLVVRIRTIKNVDITIPNASVLGGHIVNFSTRAREEGLILHSTVTIGYDVPWRQVHELLTSAASRTDGILPTPAPFVLQTSLDDFYVSYQVNAYTDQPNRMAVIYGALHQHIQDAFAEAGVEIMSPHYRAVRDGHTVTLPSDTLPGDYEAPAFRVAQVPVAAPPAHEG